MKEKLLSPEEWRRWIISLKRHDTGWYPVQRPSGKQQQRDILKSDAVPLIFNCHPEQNVCCQDAIMNSDQTLIFPYCEQPWPLQHGYKGKIILWLKFKFTFQKNKPKIFLFQPKSLIHPTSSFLHHYQIHHFLFIHFFIFMK
ncbi:uncharacterized protein LOC125036306 isoform X8 [Penaeus chinensis]|uniref:uncharacterized protein LOC125036306 isoform X8 n=1 Tax=Penaeus chinensis TaxID=139456 RepID=UPI001FB6F8CE|nr:uncharacterized protein LOC125036306 isoform X8 [Penaeus chinensis]